MLRRLSVHTPFLALLTVLVSAAPAAADASGVIADCNNNGYLTGHYSRGQLQSALNGMGADVREYTNCYDVIRRALLATAAGGGKGGGGSASGPGGSPDALGHPPRSGGAHRGTSAAVSTRGVYARLPPGTAAGHGSHQAVALTGGSVSPGGASPGAGSDARSLPTAVILVLILLGLAAASGGGVALRRRVIARSDG
jgi:hypothetical protein